MTNFRKQKVVDLRAVRSARIRTEELEAVIVSEEELSRHDPGRPIKFGEPFCGCDEELGALQREDLSSNLVVLHAIRRFGKTSLLNQVVGRLEEQGWKTIRIDMSVVTGMADLSSLIDQKLAAYSSLTSRFKQFLTKSRLSIDVSLDTSKDLPSFTPVTCATASVAHRSIST